MPEDETQTRSRSKSMGSVTNRPGATQSERRNSVGEMNETKEKEAEKIPEEGVDSKSNLKSGEANNDDAEKSNGSSANKQDKGKEEDLPAQHRKSDLVRNPGAQDKLKMNSY